MSSSGALFEFTEPDSGKRWVATPGQQTMFPLSIRNDTAEGQDITVFVEDPASWAWADPQRISLDPGNSTTVSIVFAPNRETTIAAGHHKAAIRLRDLEGVIFAECIREFEVEERQELAMTLMLRGPLMSFGMAEGIVLHCTLANRGNVDVTVTPVGDPHSTLTFSKRTVSVPFQGEAAFDIEVRWNAARRANHPDVVTLRTPYRDGEASASIGWPAIAAALEPFMPIYSTMEEEDELLSLSWLPEPEADILAHRIPDFVPEPGEPGLGPQRVSAPAALSTPSSEAPTGVADSPLSAPTSDSLPPWHPASLARRRETQYSYGRKINPWWPLVQKIGGQWRIKPLPVLLAMIAIEGFIIGLQQAQHDYYSSPQFRGRITPISRAFGFLPHTATAMLGFGRHALSATISEGQKLAHRMHGGATGPTPVLSGLSAHYANPNSLIVTFNRRNMNLVEVAVVENGVILYDDKLLTANRVAVDLPPDISAPLRVSVVGSAPGGVFIREHVWVTIPKPR